MRPGNEAELLPTVSQDERKYLVCARWALLRRCKLQLSLSAVVSYGKGMDILAQSAF